MSISLNTAGALVAKSLGTGANSKTMTISAPATLAANRAIAIPDPGFDCGLQFNRLPIITAADGANPLTVAQSGSLVLMSTAVNGTQISLPSIATSIGVHYDLVLHDQTGGTSILVNITGTAVDGMIGSVIVAGAEVPVTEGGSNSITFVSGTAVVGDHARVYCTGSKWVVEAFGDAVGSITVQG